MTSESSPHPWLQTPRLAFHTWRRPEHDPWAHALWGDPEVTRLISREPWTVEQVEARLDREIQTLADHGVSYWPLVARIPAATAGRAPQALRFVGCCGLKPHHEREGLFELGFQFVREAWGQGFATEASRAILEHAHQVMGLSEFYAGHHPENTGSRRVLEKLGFTPAWSELYPGTGLVHPGYRLSMASAAEAGGY